MFKNLLIDWVTELNEKIATAGDSGYRRLYHHGRSSPADGAGLCTAKGAAI